MAAIHETVYPRLKSRFKKSELNQFYSPTLEELIFSKKQTRSIDSQFGLLTHLKVFQRLGHFVLWSTIPYSIKKHISSCLGSLHTMQPPKNYDQSGTRNRHLDAIRKFIGVKIVDDKTRACYEQAATQAVKTKEHIPDIINIMLEQLVRQKFELPSFSTLERVAYKIRFQFNQQCFSKIANQLSMKQIKIIDDLLSYNNEGKSYWQQLKQEPKKPTINTVKAYSVHVNMLQKWQEALSITVDLPTAKYEQFYHEAYAADLTHINQLEVKRKYTYVLILLQRQTAKAVDNLVNLFVKQLKRLHNNATLALQQFQIDQVTNATNLVEHLLNITTAFQSQGTANERFLAIEKTMPRDTQLVIDQCLNHLAVAEDNELFFLPKLYKSKRFVLFNCLNNFKLESSSQQQNFRQSIRFIQQHQFTKKELLSTETLDLGWISDKWRKLVTGKTTRQSKVGQVNRRFFELCVLTELARQLESGDMYIETSLSYDNYTKKFLSWEEYQHELPKYELQSGIATSSTQFVIQLKDWIQGAARKMDNEFLTNQHVRLENHTLTVGSVDTAPQDEDYQFLDQQLKNRIAPIGILDVLVQGEQWLNLSRYFGQLSGYQARLESYPARLISTLFCYGCNLGPSEAARSIPSITRKQLAWINTNHITEQRLDKAIQQVINQYNKFQLPSFWGTGTTASADGTRWDIYEQNLISEYHIRYGSYGGLAYYHVSDKYIALCSHFIPCGVYEAIYILDGLIKNESDIQPKVVHGDTHAQSFPVFGLAYLLGIKLMPRIKRNKTLTIYRPDKISSYQNINDVFGDPINWKLIQTHLPDMLRLALSIKNGKLTPSTILRKLNSNSRKNKLYYALRELGRAVRSGFLLQYYSDEELRRIIHAATCKSEEFNNFAKWTAFANHGKIRANLKHEQIKIIKYNHLVTNLLILYNTQEMTRVVKEVTQEGYNIKASTLKALSPYRTHHINRLGNYSLNMNQKIAKLNTDFQLII